MPDEAKQPNIVVIWGDDIGITNLSCYSDGLMGYRTPNIDRLAKEGMKFTDSYGEQSCTAGRAAFITGQSVYRTGMSKVGVPGIDVGSGAGGSDDRRAAQAARLRDRPVRQEPPRRPQQAPADEPRLRRVLRQPVPPQRRGGAGDAGLPRRRELPGPPRHPEPAWRDPLVGDRDRRRRVRPQVRAAPQAAHRGHGSAQPQADGDDRRRDRRGRDRLDHTEAARTARRSSCG